MKRVVAAAASLLALVVLAEAAASQDNVSADGKTALPCELHIWPTDELQGSAFWMYNGLVQGRATNAEIKGSMKDLLTPQAQLSAMRDARVLYELHLSPVTRIIEHRIPLDPNTLNSVKTRRVTSSSPCYSELIMMRHYLTEDIVWGDRFSTTFLFRNFGSRVEAPQILKGNGGNKLKVITLAQGDRPNDALELAQAAVRAISLSTRKTRVADCR